MSQLEDAVVHAPRRDGYLGLALLAISMAAGEQLREQSARQFEDVARPLTSDRIVSAPQSVATLDVTLRGRTVSRSVIVLDAFRAEREPLPAARVQPHRRRALSMRYVRSARGAPFWALSSLGGARSMLGEREPLRTDGNNRFIDHHLLASAVERRTRVPASTRSRPTRASRLRPSSTSARP